MEDISIKNLTCCSLELHWADDDQENVKYFELYQKEGEHNIFSEKIFYTYNMIYKGKETSYEVTNLKPNQSYDFKIKIIKDKSDENEEKQISAKTLNSPHSILSKNSVDIANHKKLENDNKNLKDNQIKLIKNCSKLIFDINDKNIVKGDFDGIEIKIAHEFESNIYYVSFDVKTNYFKKFFKELIGKCGNNLVIPCQFIIQKLPTLLFFNLLEKGSIIFTGKDSEE